MRKTIYLFCLMTIVSFQSRAQTSRVLKNIDVSNTKAVYLGKTDRIDKILEENSTARTKEGQKESKNLPPNFFGRENSKVTRPDLEHQGVDPLRVLKSSSSNKEGLTPTLNIDGVGVGSPNDPSGAIGQNHYVQAVNATTIGVFLKDGTLVETFRGNVFWGNFEQRSAGDPIILYDTEYHQWIITEFAPSSTALLLVAISEDSDPLGTYSLYAFATPTFPDYPKYGIWENSVVVTTNEQGPGNLHQYFIDRHALMAGETDVNIQRVAVNGNSTEAGFFVTTPVHWSSGPKPKDSKPLVVKLNDSSWGEVDEDIIEVISFDIDFDNPDNTTVVELAIPVTPYDGNPCSESGDGFECVPQNGGGGLDAVPEVIMNVPQYRNYGTHEAFVLSFVTDVTDGENLAGIRWMEMRRNEGEDWTLYQEGTHSPDGLDRYMSSIAIDAEGNIGLAYNVSSEDEHVGVRFTGRSVDDPLGEMTFDETEAVAGINGISSGGRFGDYAHMSLDPVDGQTFWYTTEYAGEGTNSSHTRILAFKIAGSREKDLLASGILSPTTSASLTGSESIKVQVVNRGTLEVSNFALQIKLGDVIIDTYTHEDVLAAGDTLEYTFEQTIDMADLGDYKLTFDVIHEDDFQDNNQFVSTVKQLVAIDGTLILSSDKSGACLEDASFPVAVRVFNNGFDVLNNADIDFILNGELQETVAWSGSIQRGRSEQILESFTNLISGDNQLQVVLKNTNGSEDQIPEDNLAELTITNDLNMSQLVINVIPDDFPQEISWSITDGETNGIVYASSSSYRGKASGETIADFACLPQDQCFRFIMEDSFGDGFCCSDGNGSYEIIAPDGTVIFSGDGDFDSTQETDFCIGDGCQLVVEAETVNVMGNELGSMILNASGGSDYEYSINGGNSFQNSPIFEGLIVGNYEVVVKGGLACEITIFVVIEEDILTSTRLLADGAITIAPNPSQGIFNVSLTGYEEITGFLEIEVLNINGHVLQLQRFSRYGEVFQGSLSLYDYPKGIYLLRLKNLNTSQLIKVIKN